MHNSLPGLLAILERKSDMGREERLNILERLEELRQSRIICYINGDRENISTRIAPDVIPVFYRHLEMMGPQKTIELFLYTRGGDVLTPNRIVYLIREYAEYFNVLIPFRAYSAGTLLCLGADRIVMTKMGELGPIDPSVVNAFNPQDPTNPAARIPVSVEDVYSYFSLAREKCGLTDEESMAEAFSLLVERIHPLALGNVQRNYLLIRSLASRALYQRKQGCSPEEQAKIVNNLTEKMYAHNHMIPRRQAMQEIGLPVEIPGEEEESLMWQLFQDYVDEMELREQFIPGEILRGNRTEFEVISGIVESRGGQDAFIFEGIVERREFPEPGQISVNILRQGWQTVI